MITKKCNQPFIVCVRAYYFHHAPALIITIILLSINIIIIIIKNTHVLSYVINK